MYSDQYQRIVIPTDFPHVHCLIELCLIGKCLWTPASMETRLDSNMCFIIFHVISDPKIKELKCLLDSNDLYRNFGFKVSYRFSIDGRLIYRIESHTKNPDVIKFNVHSNLLVRTFCVSHDGNKQKFRHTKLM